MVMSVEQNAEEIIFISLLDLEKTAIMFLRLNGELWLNSFNFSDFYDDRNELEIKFCEKCTILSAFWRVPTGVLSENILLTNLAKIFVLLRFINLAKVVLIG